MFIPTDALTFRNAARDQVPQPGSYRFASLDTVSSDPITVSVSVPATNIVRLIQSRRV